MRHFLAAATLALFPGLAGPSAAQSVVILPDNAYASCGYILDNFEGDEALRVFMVNYIYGFMSGVNAQRKVSGQPVLDFAPIDNPMLITWTVQGCRQNRDAGLHSIMFRLHGMLLERQKP